MVRYCVSNTAAGDWQKRIEELAVDAKEREAILIEKMEIEERLRRITKLYRDLLIDDQEFRESKENLIAQLDYLVIPEGVKILDAGNYLEKLGDLWVAASSEEKREITMIILKRMFVDVSNKRILSIEAVGSFKLLLEEVSSNLDIELV